MGKKNQTVPCNECGACMPCPQGVDIPAMLHYYNDVMAGGSRSKASHAYIKQVGMEPQIAWGSRCTSCGRCTRLCPEHILVRGYAKEADKILRPRGARVGIAVKRKIRGLTNV